MSLKFSYLVISSWKIKGDCGELFMWKHLKFLWLRCPNPGFLLLLFTRHQVLWWGLEIPYLWKMLSSCHQELPAVDEWIMRSTNTTMKQSESVTSAYFFWTWWCPMLPNWSCTSLKLHVHFCEKDEKWMSTCTT